MLRNFHAFLVARCLCCFSKLTFKKIFQEQYQSVKRSVGPDLGPNCLQRLSADDKGRRWQGTS